MNNTLEINEGSSLTPKKTWKDPEVEIINRDIILSHKFAPYPEPSTSAGLHS